MCSAVRFSVQSGEELVQSSVRGSLLLSRLQQHQGEDGGGTALDWVLPVMFRVLGVFRFAL